MNIQDLLTRPIGVIGGGGHVGLPLAILLADSGFQTIIVDIQHERIEEIRRGVMLALSP